MTLIDVQGHFSYICLKVSAAYFTVSDEKSKQSND